MMKRLTQLIVLVFSFVLPFVAAAQMNEAEVILDAERFQKIPIWIMGFADGETGQQDDAGIGKQVDAILQADLRRTHVFKVMKRPTDTLPRSKAGCRAKAPIVKAKGSTASVVTWGRIGKEDGKMVLEACAYDGGKTDLIAINKRYVHASITVRLLRSMVHRWADELVSHYTFGSVPGIARTEIVYVSKVKAGRRDLFRMDYDGFGPRRLPSDPKLHLSTTPNWSPDRRAVVYTTWRDHNQEIAWLDLGKRKRRILVPPEETLNMTPSVSPDGRLLAYASAKDSTTRGNSHIFIMNLKTDVKKQLTDGARADLSPTWSPDGREIAFESDRTGRPQIYIMRADGSNVRRLTFEKSSNNAPAWSPRGDWIAYVCGLKLCRISPDGKRRFQITSGPPSERDESPSWAPNGRHLIFSSQRGRGRNRPSHIYMIQYDGTGLEQLTKGGIHHSSPAWSPLSE